MKRLKRHKASGILPAEGDKGVAEGRPRLVSHGITDRNVSIFQMENQVWRMMVYHKHEQQNTGKWSARRQEQSSLLVTLVAVQTHA
jgi:hypothetical protein